MKKLCEQSGVSFKAARETVMASKSRRGVTTAVDANGSPICSILNGHGQSERYIDHWILLCVVQLLWLKEKRLGRCSRNPVMTLDFGEMHVRPCTKIPHLLRSYFPLLVIPGAVKVTMIPIFGAGCIWETWRKMQDKRADIVHDAICKAVAEGFALTW